MRASKLIQGLPIAAVEADFEVTGVRHDSRQVETGDLFVAIPGEHFDGRAFIEEAVARGATGVLGTGPRPEQFDGPWLETPDPRVILGPLAARLNGHPHEDLLMVGVTGTNGKSTVTALVASILEASGFATGRVGTLGYSFEDADANTARTTPEATELISWLAQVRDRDGDAAVMEVSSHAMAQHRVGGLTFDLAVFTNLSRDHFDYHDGFEPYFESKRQLFSQLKPSGQAVVNFEDPYGRRLADELESRITFGAGGDVVAERAGFTLDGIEADVATPQGSLSIGSKLRGRYNLQNLLAAAACGVALGIETDKIREGLEAVTPLPGRLEPVDHGQDYPVFIDYAHTDRALSEALKSIREMAPDHRIVCVFGCGGGRDRGKRPLMGRVVGQLADLPIVTTDNPRNEDPLAIIAAVEDGLKQSGNAEYRIVPDRSEAISRAIAVAEAGWLVLIAGKGHEEGQEIGGRILPFSDREEIQRALRRKHG